MCGWGCCKERIQKYILDYAASTDLEGLEVFFIAPWCKKILAWYTDVNFLYEV